MELACSVQQNVPLSLEGRQTAALVGVVILHVLVLGDGHGVVAVLGLAPVDDDQAVGVQASVALELGLILAIPISLVGLFFVLGVGISVDV